MAGSGPQRYPGASTSSWWQTKWGGDLMEVNVACLHTTEGIGLTDYDGGAMAPNLTAVADIPNRRLRWYQHFDIDRSSRALQNLAGGVQTNTLNVVQIEFDGTCDYSHRNTWGSRTAGKDYIYWGDPPDWALQDMADFLKWLNANHGVPLTGPSMWLTYGPDSRRPGITPASYGASPARMPFNAWENFKGVCGHQHVPENDHGDPGSLPFARLIALAKGDTTPDDKPTEEGDVPHTLGLYDTTDRPLVPGKWTTLTIDKKTDLLTGATAYNADVMLTITGAPAGGTLQGRFVHLRADGSRWDAGIVERPTTAGSTFADFPHLGSIAAGEKLRFEVAYFPAGDDAKSCTITTARVRGLYWK
jgi:hypothetical protein